MNIRYEIEKRNVPSLFTSFGKAVNTKEDFEALKPTEEAIEAVTAELDRLGFSTEARKKLKKFDALIERLCERGL